MANTKITSSVITDNSIGISALNVSDGSSGQVLSTNGSGTLSFATVSGTTINNNDNNRIITGSGTANTLEGEVNLTFDGLHLGMGDNNANHPSDAFVLQLGGNAVIQGKKTAGAGKSFRVMQNVYDDASAGLSYISTDEASHYTQVNGTHSFNVAGSGSAGAAITFKEAINIRADGNVGIGAAATTVPLVLNLASDINWRFLSASSQARLMAISDNGGTYKDIGILGNNTIFYQAGTERVRIDTSGSLGLGTNNPQSLLHVSHSNGGTNATARIENTTGTVAANSVLLDLKFNGDDSFSNADYVKFQDYSGEEGKITGDGGGRVYYEITSDYRRKENIVNYDGGLKVINDLIVKNYNMISRPDMTYTGFIAHEVKDVVNGVVSGEKDATDNEGKPIYQGLDLSKLVPHLVSAIQEQQTLIESLTTRLEAVEG